MHKLIDSFLNFKEINEGRSPLTTDKYRRHLLQMVEFLGDKEIQKASRDDIVAFTGMHAHKELHLTASARRPLVSAVRGFFRWLHDRSLIDKDPARSIPYPKQGRPLPTAMQLGNAEKILQMPDLDTFGGVRDLAILSVLIGCGPRISGVRRLNEGDLIFYDDEGIEQLAIRFVEKGGRERLVPAPLDTQLMLRAYLGHPQHDEIDRQLPRGDRVLFVSIRNTSIAEHEHVGEKRRLGTRAIDRMIKKYGVMAGIPADQLSAHALRHLFGAELAEDDVNTLTMQAFLGHSDPKTSEIYAHLALRKLRKVVAKSSPMAKIKTPVSGLAALVRGRRG